MGIETQAVSNAANIATGLTAGSGIISFLNSNATIIGLGFTAASFTLAFAFGFLNYRFNKRNRKLTHNAEIKKAAERIKSEIIVGDSDHKDELLALVNAMNNRRDDAE